MKRRPRKCPGCEGPMQAFFAEGVELDRCQRCGGSWLDGGELESVIGSLKRESLGGHTDRACAFCQKPLTPSLVGPAIPVEHCAGCNGLFFDDGELEEIRFSAEAAPQRAESGHRDFYFFRCVRCAERFDFGQGRQTGEGLACRSCAREEEGEAGTPVKPPGFFRRLFSRA